MEFSHHSSPQNCYHVANKKNAYAKSTRCMSMGFIIWSPGGHQIVSPRGPFVAPNREDGVLVNRINSVIMKPLVPFSSSR